MNNTPPDVGNISAVKVGDEVTVLTLEKGKWVVGQTIKIVHAIEDWRVFVRNPEKTTSCGAWLTKNGGGCPYAMHDKNVMRYYYSANPEHIAQAKRNAKAAKAAEEKRKAEFEAMMVEARPIGVELGDGWIYGSYDDY